MIDKCIYCGHSQVAQKEVEATVNWGTSSVRIRVMSEVCMHCGGQFFSEETGKTFAEIRKRLANGSDRLLRRRARYEKMTARRNFSTSAV